MWWDGNKLRFDTMPQKPVTRKPEIIQSNKQTNYPKGINEDKLQLLKVPSKINLKRAKQ